MTDVYKVGVSLVMTGNFTQVLGALSQKLLGINAQVKELEKGFGRLGIAVTGALGAFAGEKILSGMKKMVEYGDQLVHQQNLLAAAGAKQQEIAAATAQAYRISAQVQTSNTAEVMRHIRELRYAFGRMPSENITREVELANAGMQAVGGHDYSDQVWDLVKSEEMTNRMSEPEFIKTLHLMQQVYNASGGKVTPQQFFQAFKYGRTAAASWSDEFIGGALGRAIQNLGGGSGGGGGRAGPGNALMSAYAAVVGDQTTKKAAAAFSGLGMYNNKQVSGSDLFAENPYEWVQQILMPALANKGITDPNKVRAEIERIFPNRTASQIISEFATQGRYAMGDENSLYEKDIRLQHEGMFGEAFYKMLMNKDYQTNLKAFTEQWNSMMQAIGSAMVPVAINVMQNFTNAFTSLTKIAGDNPERIRQVSQVIGALAAALVVIGGAAVIAAITPLVGAGGLIAGLAAALVALGSVDFMGITKKLDSLEQSIQGFGQSLRNWFNNANPGIMGNGSPTSYSGGAYYQPMSYTTGGGSVDGGGGGGGGGVASPSFGGGGGGGGVASDPGSSVGRSIAAPISMPTSPGVATTNSYIASQRAGFAAELADPNKRLAFAAMLDMEGLPVPDAESAMNRSSMVGKTLMQMLHSGFYGPINKGMLPGRMRSLLNNPKRLAVLNHAIATALAGSDVIHGATDQGNLKLGDPNARWPGGRTMIGSEVFNDWGGGGGHEHSRRWREHFESQALTARPPDSSPVHGNPAYSAWQWHHNFNSEHSPIAPSSSREVHVHHATYLDGRQIAKNSMKHMTKMGSGRASGARLTDFSSTRPLEV